MLRINDEFIESLLFDELETDVQFVLGNRVFNVFHPVNLQKRHYLKLQLSQAKLADNGFTYGVALEYIASSCNLDSLTLRGLVDEKHQNDRSKNAWASMMANSIRNALAELPSIYEPIKNSSSVIPKGSATIESVRHCREILEEAIPTLLRVYGLERSQALQLPSWEFDLLFDSAMKFRARQSLDRFHISALAFGGKPEDIKQVVSDLQKQAGYKSDSAPKKVVLPTEDELAAIAKRVNMMDRRKVHY